MTLIKAIYCPSCGAPLASPESNMINCGYCDSTLLIEERRVLEKRTVKTVPGPLEPPPSALISEEVRRFELSLLEQTADGSTDDGFCTLSLPEDRFALIFLRLIDEKDKTMGTDYPAHCRHLQESLVRHEDPGLAAFELLEHLSGLAPEFRLELTVLLFNPRYSSVVCYNAGGGRSVYWVSGEQGRVVDAFKAYPPLERKMLRMSQDHFSNSKPVFLASSDLVVGVSAAFAGRGGGPYSDGTRALVNTLNAQLGQHPLKVVTLAKNAFWNDRAPAASEHPLSGPLRVAAVRTRSSQPVPSWPGSTLTYMGGTEFEIVFNKTPKDHAELISLHDNREAFLLFDGEDFDKAEYEKAREVVLQILDRPNHGDNENPRRAGREASEAVGHSGRCLVLLLLNNHGRSKWYRHGWSQPLGLGARGLSDPPSAQCFDQGGEASVYPGQRQFFPGSLPFTKAPKNVDELAEAWYGGKASALYEALFAHWRKPKPGDCLSSLLQAARGDIREASLDGCCLLSRR
jgi:DNA-directed RNA polymerase subunit RPC12/RpoP